MLGDLFSSGFMSQGLGYCSDPRQMQAVPQAQLDRLIATNLHQMSQALVNLNYGMLAQNVFASPQRPLDERFSDFKVRLAAACEKHGLVA